MVFLGRDEAASAQRYCSTLERLRNAIHCQRLVLLLQGVTVLHQNTRPHNAYRNCD